jgi:hypothetical protein
MMQAGFTYVLLVILCWAMACRLVLLDQQQLSHEAVLMQLISFKVLSVSDAINKKIHVQCMPSKMVNGLRVTPRLL